MSFEGSEDSIMFDRQLVSETFVLHYYCINLGDEKCTYTKKKMVDVKQNKRFKLIKVEYRFIL